MKSRSLPTEIAGSCYAGSVSPTNYHNTTTGSWDNAYGEGMFYTFKPNGQFEFGYRIYSSLYGCTITAMFWKSGPMTIAKVGPTITLHPSEAILHSTDSCGASGNYDKEISKAPEILTWELGRDEYDEEVLTIHWAGVTEGKTFYRWNP